MNQQTTSRFGSLLGPITWAELAEEYLAPSPRRPAAFAARSLGAFLASEVRTVGPGRFHYGATWATTSGQPYDDLADLSADYQRSLCTGEPVLVSTDHCDHPVWSEVTNVRFRIWHDTAHVAHGLGFGVDDELQLFALQAADGDAGLTADQVDALFCESVYQLSTYVHLGEYPPIQRVRTPGPVGRAVRDLLLDL